MGRVILKQGPNFKVYDDGTILIEKVRLSYPHLTAPYKGKDDKGEAKYGVVGLLPKATHMAAKTALKEAIDAIIKEAKLKEGLASDKKFLRNGDDMGKEDYKGMFVLSARETRRPILRNKAAERISIEEAKELFYGGCWGTLLVRPWYQSNTYGKRVNAGLSACQFFRDDAPFGEGRLSEEDVDETFESYEDGEVSGTDDFDDEDDI